eukprot:TRINITY_DN45188_c0_g1_i3.p1 TRINITY_DN45188_c0_g1~~TRINITY_DN45188_c0_g1_i3.p1  ORF type:complete len:539 (+),score=97.40 TRINITY_DN45188_c0_g1_i3:190-1806(+)
MGQQLWYSDASEPLAAYFGAWVPPLVGDLEWSTSKALHTTVRLLSQAAPGSQPPASDSGAESLPHGFAAKWAAYYQIRVWRDASVGVATEDLRARSICEGTACKAEGASYVREVVLRLKVADLGLELGGRFKLAVRVGDEKGRWSEWAWSEERQADMAPFRCPSGRLAVTGPRNRKMTFAWDALICDSGMVPAEYTISMVPSCSSVDEEQEGQDMLLAYCSDLKHSAAVNADSALTAVVGQGVRRCCSDQAVVYGYKPGRRYVFVLRAKIDSSVLRGAASQPFLEVARSEEVLWPESSREEWTREVDWTVPVPVQVPLPADLEDSSHRWNAANAVLLAWPAVRLEGGEDEEAGGQESPHSTHAPEAAPYDLEAREEYEAHPVFGWMPAPWVRIRLSGVDYAAATDLPFQRGRFRWRLRPTSEDGQGGVASSAAAGAGPSSDLCIAHVPTPGQPSAEVFCTRSAVRLVVTAAVHAERTTRPGHPQPLAAAAVSMSFQVRVRQRLETDILASIHHCLHPLTLFWFAEEFMCNAGVLLAFD